MSLSPRGPKRIQRIELSEKNKAIRIVAIVLLLAVAAVALTAGLTEMLNVKPGWQEIEANSQIPNCSSDFILDYDFSDYGGAANQHYREVVKLYTEATEKTYQIFSTDVASEGLHNVHYVNSHVNEIVTVDDLLYNALQQIQKYSHRSLYLAPVYVEYNRIFTAESEETAASFDPAQNKELVPYIQQAAAFGNDPAMIDVELLGDNKIRLRVSEEYLAFAQEYEIDEFIDFSWMKNAFIADYIADILVSNGYNRGYLASYDGFTRNLDDRGNQYSFNIFDRLENNAVVPGVMHYSGPVSIVFMRNYPMSNLDQWHYRAFSAGNIASVYIDAADGMTKSSVNNLVSYSSEVGCAEIMLQMSPAFLAEELEKSILSDLTEQGICSIWSEERTIIYNDKDLSLELLPLKDGAVYAKSYFEG